jgi:uncharacterized membrane protein YcaP (DUF421 family)
MGAALRAIFGYCFLVLMVRIAGRRPGKQITPFEFVLIFYMGGVTLTAMVADDRSLTNALVQVICIACTHYVLAWLRHRSPGFGTVIDGTPLVLLKDGRWQMEPMKNMRLQDDDVMAAARDKGLERLDQIKYAVLERNGEIVVFENEKEK